jgi:hypothetical protein
MIFLWTWEATVSNIIYLIGKLPNSYRFGGGNITTNFRRRVQAYRTLALHVASLAVAGEHIHSLKFYAENIIGPKRISGK